MRGILPLLFDLPEGALAADALVGQLLDARRVHQNLACCGREKERKKNYLPNSEKGSVNNTTPKAEKDCVHVLVNIQVEILEEKRVGCSFLETTLHLCFVLFWTCSLSIVSCFSPEWSPPGKRWVGG